MFECQVYPKDLYGTFGRGHNLFPTVEIQSHCTREDMTTMHCRERERERELTAMHTIEERVVVKLGDGSPHVRFPHLPPSALHLPPRPVSTSPSWDLHELREILHPNRFLLLGAATPYMELEAALKLVGTEAAGNRQASHGKNSLTRHCVPPIIVSAPIPRALT